MNGEEREGAEDEEEEEEEEEDDGRRDTSRSRIVCGLVKRVEKV